MQSCLAALKFLSNRPRSISILLINTFQISLLVLLMKDTLFHYYYDVTSFFINLDNFFVSQHILYALFIKNIILVSISTLYFLHYLKKSIIFQNIISHFLKTFPYIFFVPLFHLSLKSALNENFSLLDRLISILNIAFFVFYNILHDILNESLKFTEIDYCNCRKVLYRSQILAIIGLTCLIVLNDFYSSIIYGIRAIIILVACYNKIEYELTQKIQLFYSFLTLYLCFIVFIINFGIIKLQVVNNLVNSTFFLIFGVIVILDLTDTVYLKINQNFINSISWEEKAQQISTIDKRREAVRKIENEINILIEAFIQRQKFNQNQKNSYNQYWKIYNEAIFFHKTKCQDVQCLCKVDEADNEKNDSNIYLSDLNKKLSELKMTYSKESKLKIFKIYLLIQIIKRPLTGYYELISLKKLKNQLLIKVEIQHIVKIGRQCFDQINYKFKVLNRQIELLDFMYYEQKIQQLQKQIKDTIEQTINFYEIFTSHTIKTRQIQKKSTTLFTEKKKVQNKLIDLVKSSHSSSDLNAIIFIFYRLLEIYRSKQSQLKKIIMNNEMRKRIYLKNDPDLSSSDNGIIYIDLVDQRGIIKKVTKNIPIFFNNKPEDMLQFNIKLFMPRIFSRHHPKFLSNFVDFGRIKLLNLKEVMVFGKDKNKFIFPVNARVKTEHLQEHQFGATTLLSKIKTNSQFIIVDQNGKIDDITQILYRKLFSKTLKEEVNRINSLSINKMILSSNQFIENSDKLKFNKIHQGLLIYTDEVDYLYEKFKFSKEVTHNSMVNNKVSTFSMISLHSETNLNIQEEKYTYFVELFKNFLVDLNIFKIKGFKINYKIHKICTSEFQTELYEIINVKEDVEKKLFFRELILELINVAQIYRLYEENSFIWNHISHLQELINRRNYGQLRIESNAFSQIKNSNPSQQINEQNIQLIQASVFQNQSQKNSFQKISLDNFSYQNKQNQNLLANNHQQSQQSSLLGNQQESKKQILINAFNKYQNSSSSPIIIFLSTMISILIVSLVLSSIFVYIYSNQMKGQWKDNNYILQIWHLTEFKFAFIEIQSFYSYYNVTIDSQFIQQVNMINEAMKNLANKINLQSVSSDLKNGIFSNQINLYDALNLIYLNVSFPELLNQLTWLFQLPNQKAKPRLLQNYQQLHIFFQDIYNKKSNQQVSKIKQFLSIINYLFIAYELLLGLILIICIIVYLVYKKQEIAVRDKLIYMNIRQIKKSIFKFSQVKQILNYKNNSKINLVSMIQDSSEKKQDQQNNIHSVNRSLKIVDEDNKKNFYKNPYIYIVFFSLVVFFSNLSITFFILSSNILSEYNQNIKINQQSVYFQIKTPMLINLYLSNINRALTNQQIKIYSESLYYESNSRFFQVFRTFAQNQYQNNQLSIAVNQDYSMQICKQIECQQFAKNYTINLAYLQFQFKNKLNFWRPTDHIVLNSTTIQHWKVQNNILTILDWIHTIYKISQKLNLEINNIFDSQMNEFQNKLILVSVLLIPLNILVFIVAQLKYLNFLKKTMKSAVQIFMHFPVNVLIQNTYLTSYFNSIMKQNK